MGRLEAFFDYPDIQDRPDAMTLSHWLTERFADGWSWAGESPRHLVVDGLPVHRFRFSRDTRRDGRSHLRLGRAAGVVRPPRPRQPF
jgi:hypothetical protein